MPAKSECLIFSDASRELSQAIRTTGPIVLSSNPPISLIHPTVSGSSFLETMFNQNQVAAVLEAVRGFVALSYSYDPSLTRQQGSVRDTLVYTALAFLLVKPTRWFGKYWFRMDDQGQIEALSRDFGFIHLDHPSPYLWYQQHNTVTLEDVESVKRCLSRLLHAFFPGTVSGSWSHPCGSIHRALVMLAEGYLTEMFGELRPFLWAMALDCLLSSRTDKRKRGAQTIDQRLRMLFGAEFEPYKAVSVPGHQSRPNHKLCNIVKDIFILRNACAHGLTIPDAWLTPPGRDLYEGYAYQLSECTEILLRQTLLLILNDQRMFDVFVDSRKLDRYFG
jgi:hypothetical protein